MRVIKVFKLLTAVLIGTMFLGIGSVYASNVRVFVEGTLLVPQDAAGNTVQPFIQDGTTFLPIRAIGEAFGRDIGWDAQTTSVIIGTRPSTISPSANDNIRVFVDGTERTLRDANNNVVNPINRGGTIFVPVRAIGEIFDRDIHWDASNVSVFVGRGTFDVRASGRTYTITMADLLALNPRTVSAYPRGERRTFTGVPLSALFNRAGVNTAGLNTVTFRAEDGFFSVITMAEALEASNVYIVTHESGVALGSYGDGGRGPFMVVVSEDPFPNRWCRYLIEVVLE